jgi:hypothetical protein
MTYNLNSLNQLLDSITRQGKLTNGSPTKLKLKGGGYHWTSNKRDKSSLEWNRNPDQGRIGGRNQTLQRTPNLFPRLKSKLLDGPPLPDHACRYGRGGFGKHTAQP